MKLFKTILVVVGIVTALASATKAQTPRPIPDSYDGHGFMTYSQYSDICVGGTVRDQLGSQPLGASGYQCVGGKPMKSDILLAINSIRTSQSLERIVVLLQSMEQRLSANTTAVERVEATMEKQNTDFNRELQDSITRMFARLPADLLGNDLFKQKLEDLKKEILDEVKKPTPPPNN